jgi:hypothetical protein
MLLRERRIDYEEGGQTWREKEMNWREKNYMKESI